MNKLKKLISILLIALVLVFSSPLQAFAQEATEAVEAQEAQEAQTAQEPTPTPEPSVETQVQGEPESAQEAAPAVEAIEADDGDTPEEDALEEIERQERIAQYEQYLIDQAEWNKNNNYGGNVGNSSIETGDATAGGVVINNVNSATTSVSPSCSVCSDSASVTNSNNGAGSGNTASVDTANNLDVVIDNDANLDNNLDFSATSGNNSSSYNVGSTEISTGDANVSGVLINSANETGIGVVEYNIIEDYVGDIILLVPDNLFGCTIGCVSGDFSAQNSGNGADSTNDASIDSVNNTNVDITNDADIVNSMDLVAVSGHNDTSYNTGGDSTIETGDANVAANILNFANSTVIGGALFVVNIFGDLIGDIIFPDSLPGIGGTSLSATNTGNGSGSTNDSSIDTNNQTNVDLNNTADINNILNIDGNTGGNLTSANTGGDNSIDTGDVYINAEVLNLANLNYLNTSDEPLWVILVNNMGTWTGNIIGALTGTNYSGSDGLVFNVDENGEIVATNSGNGADSVNTADINSSNTNNIAIDNTANVTNELNITANTGDNRASYNTGGDSKIKTGDANIAASIVNFINSNIIGPKLMIGIINVFGTWRGDAVPPGAEQEANNSSNSQNVGGANQNSTGGSSGGNNSSNNSSSSTEVSGGVSGSVKSNGNGLSNFFFGGLGNSDSEGQGVAAGDEGAQVLSAKNSPNVISLSINWKMLLLALLPLTLYVLLRYRQITKERAKSTLAIAHEIKK